MSWDDAVSEARRTEDDLRRVLDALELAHDDDMDALEADARSLGESLALAVAQLKTMALGYRNLVEINAIKTIDYDAEALRLANECDSVVERVTGQRR